MLSINQQNPNVNTANHADTTNPEHTGSRLLSVFNISGLAEKIVPNLSLSQATSLARISPELMDIIGKAFAQTAPDFKAELPNAPAEIRARFQQLKLGHPDNVQELRKLLEDRANPMPLPTRMAGLPSTAAGTDVDGLRMSTASTSRNPFARLRLGN